MLSPEQFRNALKNRTSDRSPSRMVKSYGADQGRSAANDSLSRSMLLGSSAAPLTSRMQAVSPGHLFEASTARRGAWIDERIAHSDRATSATASAGTHAHAAERSRRSSGAAQIQQYSTGSAGGRNSSQPRQQEQEQFELDLRERGPLSSSGLGPTRGPVGGQSVRGAWVHIPHEVKRSPSASLYFRSQVANFGMTAVGTNARQKLELCNSSGEEVSGIYCRIVSRS